VLSPNFTQSESYIPWFHSQCRLMACCRLQMLVLLCLASVVSSVTIKTRPPLSELPEWQQNVSHVLEVEGIEEPEKQTAIVTFAGKGDLSYIDGAVMLGLSIQKHVPGYPMVALVIEDMKSNYQSLLQEVGWKLVTVPNWDAEYCGVDCDTTFLKRWRDSFEKINAFRLPFRRVLYLDSDTYVFSSRLNEIITARLPAGNIAMAKDGCKNEYNSGVMLYEPDLEVFKDMLHMVSNRKREQILDQELVNSAYENQITEFAREFNCVDTMGIRPGQRKACDWHCSSNAVVAHFTGHPKPTSAKRRLLELVRRPGSPEIACANTNFGSCAQWSQYYCDIRENAKNVSKDLQHALTKSGHCCHGAAAAHKESCKECLSLVAVSGSKSLGDVTQDIDGTYAKTNIKPAEFNGGKPIYVKPETVQAGSPVYMYYSQPNVMWFIGGKYDSNQYSDFVAYAGKDAPCPRDAGAWQFQVEHGNLNGHMRVQPMRVLSPPKPPDAPRDTDRIVWNIETHQWEREEAVQGWSNSFDDDDSETA